MDAAAAASSSELVETEAAAATSLVRNPCSFAEMENIQELERIIAKFEISQSQRRHNDPQ